MFESGNKLLWNVWTILDFFMCDFCDKILIILMTNAIKNILLFSELFTSLTERDYIIFQQPLKILRMLLFYIRFEHGTVLE